MRPLGDALGTGLPTVDVWRPHRSGDAPLLSSTLCCPARFVVQHALLSSTLCCPARPVASEPVVRLMRPLPMERHCAPATGLAWAVKSSCSWDSRPTCARFPREVIAVGGALVSALRVVLPRRGGAARRARRDRRSRDGLPVGADLHFRVHRRRSLESPCCWRSVVR
jgi:hypothetical protein